MMGPVDLRLSVGHTPWPTVVTWGAGCAMKAPSHSPLDVKRIVRESSKGSKKSGKETLFKPYASSGSSEEAILITSMVIPLYDAQQFLGVVGAGIALAILSAKAARLLPLGLRRFAAGYLRLSVPGRKVSKRYLSARMH